MSAVNGCRKSNCFEIAGSQLSCKLKAPGYPVGADGVYCDLHLDQSVPCHHVHTANAHPMFWGIKPTSARATGISVFGGPPKRPLMPSSSIKTHRHQAPGGSGSSKARASHQGHRLQAQERRHCRPDGHHKEIGIRGRRKCKLCQRTRGLSGCRIERAGAPDRALQQDTGALEVCESWQERQFLHIIFLPLPHTQQAGNVVAGKRTPSLFTTFQQSS